MPWGNVLQGAGRRRRIVNRDICRFSLPSAAALPRKPTMIRFSTVAANADVLGEDTPMAEPQGSPAQPRDDTAVPQPGRDRRDCGAARPGKDINAAGFVKDKDSAKPT